MIEHVPLRTASIYILGSLNVQASSDNFTYSVKFYGICHILRVVGGTADRLKLYAQVTWDHQVVSRMGILCRRNNCWKSLLLCAQIGIFRNLLYVQYQLTKNLVKVRGDQQKRLAFTN